MQKSIIYNGKKYGFRHCVNNVIREYNNAESIEKQDFYSDASNFAYHLALKSGRYSYSQVCGIIAALSPLKTWQQNKQLTFDFVMNDKRNGTIKTFMNKAILISELRYFNLDSINTVLSGEKTTAFFNNIYDQKNTNYLTIDRHAVNIALNKIQYTGGINYEFFKAVYVEAANQLNISSISLQAIVWLSWRKRNQFNKTKKVK